MPRLLMFLAGLVVLSCSSAEAYAKRPMTIDDLFRFARIADPQVSPDGKSVVYQVTSVDSAANTTRTSLWLAAVDGKTPPRQLTSAGKSDRHPRWSPDGSTILFESNRSGTNQLWTIAVNGGEATQLTTLSTGAANGIWSPDGSTIAFVSAVYPEFSGKPFAESDKLNKARIDEAANNPVQARVFNRLFFRHWDEYVGDKRQHLFTLKVDTKAFGGVKAIGEPLDVTPGDRDAYPTSTTFSVGDDFTFSPNSKFLLFTAVPEKNEAWSTNYDICRVAVTGGPIQTLTKANAAADGSPRFSPDGRRLAYRAQKKVGYEADKWDILLVDTDTNGTFLSEPLRTTAKYDLSVNEFIWAGPHRFLLTADSQGSVPLFSLDLLRPDDKNLFKFDFHPIAKMTVGSNSSLSWTSANGGVLAFAHAEMVHPNEVFVATGELSSSLQVRNLSNANGSLREELELPYPESVTVTTPDNAAMQMWILQPPGFDPKKKWPVAFLVHGGPQGAWEDGWSFRWNAQLWAAQGYVVALPNPRGSTGFGQKFVDQISGDWGGKCYADLMAGADYVEKLSYVDKTRIGSAGASFGGYMMNWFAVNTGRFQCLITHCSVWNFESMWGTTDELWFDEYEHGGLPWEVPGKYAEFSPHKKAANLAKFKTPMLLIHNDLDFRCPIGQGHELFSTLQRLGVPSRFVNFPDEGHWVLKPMNSRFWHREVFAWLTKYVPPGGR